MLRRCLLDSNNILELIKMASATRQTITKVSSDRIDTVINKFHTLRSEQRSLAAKLTEFQLEFNEHRLVIATLKNVDENRTCYRLIGGILTEKKVKNVLPVLIVQREKLIELITKLGEQLAKKNTEFEEYQHEHDLHIRNLNELVQENENDIGSKKNRENVLVT